MIALSVIFFVLAIGAATYAQLVVHKQPTRDIVLLGVACVLFMFASAFAWAYAARTGG